MRRLGSLADQLQIDDLAGKLSPLVPPQWDLDLDPELKDTSAGFRDGTWRIRWPVSPEMVAEELAH